MAGQKTQWKPPILDKAAHSKMHSEVDKAMSYACRVLTYRRRTIRELTVRLVEHGFSEETTRSVMDTLVQYGYIDDKAYARLWIEQRLQKRGFAALKRELLQKGIDPAVIEELLEKAGPELEFQAAYQLALKKLSQSSADCPFPYLARFLQNRGYSYQSIRRVGQTIADNAAES